MKLRPIEQILAWQTRLSKLFSYMLRHGMPMEQLQIASFKESLFQSRNAEEGLLVDLNACSRLTKQISVIDQLEPATFGAWFRRIQGQRGALVVDSLSLLDLRGSWFYRESFFGANLQGTNLEGSHGIFAFFRHANLEGANLARAVFIEANLQNANLERANLEEAILNSAHLEEAYLKGANLSGANLSGAILAGANLAGANLEAANLRRSPPRRN
jgi:uncharacterized protein YjbI with pentapeptide repeats